MSRNSQLERLLNEYEHRVKTTPGLGWEGIHVASMFPTMRKMVADAGQATGEERAHLIFKVNRWLGFAQGFLWLKGGRSIEVLANETRGVDAAWGGHATEGA